MRGSQGRLLPGVRAPARGRESPDAGATPDLLEFRRRFPIVPGAPHYCATCSLRDRADAEARQLFWFRLAK
jgi:hypothetical protein